MLRIAPVDPLCRLTLDPVPGSPESHLQRLRRCPSGSPCRDSPPWLPIRARRVGPAKKSATESAESSEFKGTEKERDSCSAGVSPAFLIPGSDPNAGETPALQRGPGFVQNVLHGGFVALCEAIIPLTVFHISDPDAGASMGSIPSIGSTWRTAHESRSSDPGPLTILRRTGAIRGLDARRGERYHRKEQGTRSRTTPRTGAPEG